MHTTIYNIWQQLFHILYSKKEIIVAKANTLILQ